VTGELAGVGGDPVRREIEEGPASTAQAMHEQRQVASGVPAEVMDEDVGRRDDRGQETEDERHDEQRHEDDDGCGGRCDVDAPFASSWASRASPTVRTVRSGAVVTWTVAIASRKRFSAWVWVRPSRVPGRRTGARRRLVGLLRLHGIRTSWRT
jgi:hypothetical protein